MVIFKIPISTRVGFSSEFERNSRQNLRRILIVSLKEFLFQNHGSRYPNRNPEEFTLDLFQYRWGVPLIIHGEFASESLVDLHRNSAGVVRRFLSEWYRIEFSHLWLKALLQTVLASDTDFLVLISKLSEI